MSDLAKEIIPVNIEDELRGSYLDYAMSVIVGRSLPDVRCICTCSYAHGLVGRIYLRNFQQLCTCCSRKVNPSYMVFLTLIKVSLITNSVSNETNIPVNHMNASVMFMSSAMLWASFVHHKSRVKSNLMLFY
jgi:hypothetical protein